MGYFGAACALILERLRLPRGLRSFPNLVVGLPAFLLAACASAPKATFDLSPASASFAARATQKQLAISLPESTLPENSDRIVVRADAQAVAYLEGAQWADKLPLLVQSRLIESFQNAHLLRAAGRPGMLADFTLETLIRRFELDPSRGEATVEISAQLTDVGGRARATKLFAASIASPSIAPDAAAMALDAASREVMREIVLWAAQKV
jgi:cholesterol transport system auxiliary component